MSRRIPERALKASVFFYPTPDEARIGRPTGGSGFLIGVPWESEPKYVHIYAVTNRHVIEPKKADPALSMRFNRKGGGTEVVETQLEDWHSPPTGDIAVRLCILDGHKVDYSWDKVSDIVSEEIIALYNLGIGDDVFSMGRFLDIDDGLANRPVMRFGHVAAMPPVPVLVEPGKYQDSYLIEMRSRTGFSGSPVYIFVEPPLVGEWVDRGIYQTLGTGLERLSKLRTFGPWILGVHWGQMPVAGPEAFDMETKRPASYGSGISAVVPGQILRQFLSEDEILKKERLTLEERWNAQLRFNQESAATAIAPAEDDSLAKPNLKA